jgi:DnaK suppressor protein
VAPKTAANKPAGTVAQSTAKPDKVAATAAPAPAAAATASSSKPAKTSAKPPEGGVVATYVRVNPRPVEVPQDNDEGEDGNLLSGPRNVQPYIVKRGEQYMSREQLQHFRNILEDWKRDLMREVDRTVSHMKDEAANFPDPNDRATQEEEFSLELRTRDRERKLIRKIEEALQRIEDGSYGYCLETGEEIGVKRLEARPVATLSLEAQERRERREKQYGDRDDRYR